LLSGGQSYHGAYVIRTCLSAEALSYPSGQRRQSESRRGLARRDVDRMQSLRWAAMGELHDRMPVILAENGSDIGDGGDRTNPRDGHEHARGRFPLHRSDETMI
jgi:hypothetical protein